MRFIVIRVSFLLTGAAKAGWILLSMWIIVERYKPAELPPVSKTNQF
jgi:hypothetical protein